MLMHHVCLPVHRHMPEYALPFAIHQLAHQRVASPDDLVTPATTQKLSFIIDGLVRGAPCGDAACASLTHPLAADEHLCHQ